MTGRKRLLLAAGTAGAALALGIGGVAVAASGDAVPEQGYVTIEDGSDGTTPSPGGSGTEGQSQDGTTGQQRDGDCPEKDGSGSGSSEGQGQGQSEQTPESSDLQDQT